MLLQENKSHLSFSSANLELFERLKVFDNLSIFIPVIMRRITSKIVLTVKEIKDIFFIKFPNSWRKLREKASKMINKNIKTRKKET